MVRENANKKKIEKTVTLKGQSSLCKKKRPNGTSIETLNESKFHVIRVRPGALVTSRQSLTRCHIRHNQFE